MVATANANWIAFINKTFPAWPRNVNFNPNNGNANVNNDNPKNHNPKRGVRRPIRVYLLCVALIHPPSILPISATILWIWNILVSFTSFNSSNKRSFKVAISRKLLAFKRYEPLRGFGAFLAMMSCERHSRMVFSRLMPSEYRHRFFSVSFISITPL